MARRKSTTGHRASANPPMDFNAMAREAADFVKNKKRAVELLAMTIADFMQQLHGGDWRIQVEHDAGLVMVARRAEARRPPIDPASLKTAV